MVERTLLQRIVTRGLHMFWRRWRGLHLGARALVLDGNGGVLLVRGDTTSPWRLPGGEVLRDESTATALARHLRDSAGIAQKTGMKLLAIYADLKKRGSNHIALHEMRYEDALTHDNAAARFFPLDNLPAEICAHSRMRLKEHVDKTPPAEHW